MPTSEDSPINSLINALTSDQSFGENIAHLHITDARHAAFEELPPDLNPSLRDSLVRRGIDRLYSHQTEAIALAAEHKSFVISTGTSSGKSLCYQLPILNTICAENDSTALMIFPTKALTNDQLNSLHELIPPELRGHVRVAIYDGDTPQKDRAAIREQANIILTNPDMLNIGILPHNPIWERFFRNLKYVVIDEIHIYRGIFGSHVANLIRRLHRITRFYGAKPVFIMTSATIHNPLQHANQLIQQEVSIINTDGSPQGQKYFMVYNPPMVNEEFGIREGLLSTTGKFLALLYQKSIQTLVFCRTRRFVEILLRDTRAVLRIPQARIRGYRSGYLRGERREIEEGLKNGEIKIGIATNALELGVDIGGVDAVLLPGYPGTISALVQRAGRAGRKFNPSLAIFIASMNPLDQFLARNPQYLLSRNPEEALINPDNPLILIEHLQATAAEGPIEENEHFGNLPAETLRQYLDYLTEAGLLFHKNSKYHWVSNDYPTQHISLRSASSGSILLRAQNLLGEVHVIGEVDYNSGLWMVHPGAVYIHDGETYRVEELDLETSVANLSLFAGDYITDPILNTEVEILSRNATVERNNFILNLGEVIVTSKVTGFKRIHWTTREVLDTSELDLPATDLRTMAFWMVVKPECVDKLRDAGMWRSDPNHYGSNWAAIRDRIRMRDDFTCQVCGKRESVSAHHVHHKVPFKSFTSSEKANIASNLVTLCADCHALAENQVRVRSALSGLNHLMESLAPLMVMSDSSDLGSFFDPAARFAENQPAIIFYDNVPAGIGLTEYLFNHFDDLLLQAGELVKTCECSEGCPSCVGPSIDLASGGKKETQQLIKYLQE
jgi:DEAD/DEAH box helicase domain-containing protein